MNPRRFVSLLALCLLGLTAACTRPVNEDEIHIRFAVWGSVEQTRTETQIIEAFHEQHSGIRVELHAIGARYPEMMQAMFVGNVAPDVFMVRLFEYYDWASRGILSDLTDLYEDLHRQAEVLPVPARLARWKDRVYGLPINAHGLVMYYNKDAFQQAGVPVPESGFSWKELEKIAPRLAARHGDPNAPTDYIAQMPHPFIIFWQHGVELFDDLRAPTKVTVNDPRAVEALTFLRRLDTSGYTVPPEIVLDEGSFQLFRDGRTAVYFSFRALTPEIAGHTEFEWDVLPLPNGPASGVTLHGGATLGIWSHTPHEEAARTFARFYASPEGAKIAMQNGRTAPVYREIAYGDSFRELNPPENIQAFAETMEDGASQFILYAPGGQEVRRIFNQRIEQALARPEIPAEAVLNGMEDDLERWLRRMKQRGFL